MVLVATTIKTINRVYIDFLQVSSHLSVDGWRLWGDSISHLLQSVCLPDNSGEHAGDPDKVLLYSSLIRLLARAARQPTVCMAQ